MTMRAQPVINKGDMEKYEEQLHSPAMKCSQCDFARVILDVARSRSVTWKDGKVSFT